MLRISKSVEKKIIPLLLAAALIATVLCPQTVLAYNETEAAEMYNNAGELYRSNFFGEALRIYEELIASGVENPDLYFNASNAAYRAGSIGKAVLYIEKTLQLNPSDPDALSNLRFLNTQKQDREPENDNAVIAFFARQYGFINVNSVALWSGISFAAAMLLAALSLFIDGWLRQVLIGIAVVCTVIFVLSTVITLQKVNHSDSVVEAVIMEPEVNAYSGPGEDNTHIFNIHEGTKVVIERTQDEWNLIRLQSGAGGWISADAMEKI